MPQSPLVSIITPVSDRWQYIGQCIESVLSQTFSDWEQIIVDDSVGSDVEKVVQKYLDDDRIHYHKQEHVGIEGLGSTYNRALGLSRGKFIAVLEDDDFWPTDKLEEQLKLFSDEDVVLTWGKVRLVDSDNKEIGDFPLAWERYSDAVLCNNPVGSVLEALLVNIPMGPAVTVMLRRKPLEEIGGFWQPQGAYYVDHSTWLKMSLKGAFAYSHETLGYWRIHKTQVSSSIVQSSSGMAGKVFWETLSLEERKQFGVEHMDKIVNAKYWMIRGHRAMASGDYEAGRAFLRRVLDQGRSPFRIKATFILLLSYLAPRVVRFKLSSPLPFFLWLKKEVLNL